jgi:hypothetical protein
MADASAGRSPSSAGRHASLVALVARRRALALQGSRPAFVFERASSWVALHVHNGTSGLRTGDNQGRGPMRSADSLSLLAPSRIRVSRFAFGEQLVKSRSELGVADRQGTESIPMGSLSADQRGAAHQLLEERGYTLGLGHNRVRVDELQVEISSVLAGRYRRFRETPSRSPRVSWSCRLCWDPGCRENPRKALSSVRGSS